jgi:hypothetical protein
VRLNGTVITDARYALTWIAQVRATSQHDEQGDEGAHKEDDEAHANGNHGEILDARRVDVQPERWGCSSQMPA